MAIIVNRSHEIAFEYTPGVLPCVVFCGGFNSNMQGTKAVALEQHCQERGQAFVRFDYQGHGDSGGDFADGSISTWLEDTLAIIDQVADDNVLLIGSSMGGWLALHSALKRKDKVTGLILLACAADMTRYYPQRLEGLPLESDTQNRAFYSVANQYDDQQPYRVYQKLLDDGAKHYLLDNPIELSVPVHLLHGMLDDVVPWQRSEQVLSQLTSPEVNLHLLKNSDHRLSNPNDIRFLKQLVDIVLAASGRES